MCKIVEFSCPIDMNTTKEIAGELEVFATLVRNLQIMCPGYKFLIVSIVVGAMGYVPKCHLLGHLFVPKCLVIYLKMVGFEGKEIKLF